MALCPICSAPSDGKRVNFNGYDIYDLCLKCASYSVCLISPNADIPVKENAIRWAEREIQNNAEKIYLANCLRSWKSCAEDYITAHIPEPVIAPPAVEAADIDNSEIDLDATVRGFDFGSYSPVAAEDDSASIDSSMLDIRKSDFFSKDEPEILAHPVSVPVEEAVPAPFSVPYDEAAEHEPSPENFEETSEVIEEFAAEAFRRVFNEELPTDEEEDEMTEEDFEAEERALLTEVLGEDYDSDSTDAVTDGEIDAEADAFYKEASENFTENEPYIKDYLREISLTLRSINEKMERLEKEISELRK